MTKVNVGIDIGGTTVKFGVIDYEGNILQKWEIRTNTDDSGKMIVEEINESLQGKKLQLSAYTIKGVGVGVPGFLDHKTGMVYQAVNLGWKHVNLAKQLEDKLNVPVYIENDANVAALGENWAGVGNRAEHLIMITLGTGVGGGIISHGNLISGANGSAGEIGHMTVEPNGYLCNCGRRGCLETITSATGIVRQALEKIKEDTNLPLAKHVERYGEITAKDIFALAKEGDASSLQIINHSTDVLGLALANLSTVINPTKILIGGGVSKAGDQLLIPLQKAFNKYALPRIKSVCDIEIAKLGNDAGIIGASFLVNQYVK